MLNKKKTRFPLLKIQWHFSMGYGKTNHLFPSKNKLFLNYIALFFQKGYRLCTVLELMWCLVLEQQCCK